MVLILMVLLLAGSGVLRAVRRPTGSWVGVGLVPSRDGCLKGVLTCLA